MFSTKFPFFYVSAGEKAWVDLLWLGGLAAFALVFFALRLDVGVDLSDEAYYATHIIEWMRNGFRAGKSLLLPQLSELPAYPLARLYIALSGGLNGLVLFLRVLYVGMALAAAAAIYLLVRRLRPRPVAALAAALPITYIPFSLPAPSYNTIAMFALAGALALYGGALLNVERSSRASRPTRVLPSLIGSAVLLTITAIVYPTLAIAPVLLFAVAWGSARRREEVRLLATFIGVCAICAAAGAGLLLAIFGFERLLAMVEFTTGLVSLVGGFTARMQAAGRVFANQPLVIAGLVWTASALVVLFAMKLRHERVAATIAIVPGLVLVLSGGPVAYLKSHDVIILCLIIASYVVAIEIRGSARTIVPGLLFVSLVSGAVTGSTSAGHVNNIAIGGLFAAAVGLALLTPPDFRQGRLRVTACVLPLAFVLAATGYSSQTWVYGEVTGGRPAIPTRVESGPFKGLVTAPEMHAYVDAVTRAFEQHTRSGETLTVFGALSGLYLLNDLVPHAPSTWPLRSYTGERARGIWEMLLAKNPPDIIAIYDDRWIEPIGETEKQLLLRYAEVARFSVSFRDFRLYRRLDTPLIR
ncbi:hypothetical protein [Candidatus Raskinella chloraquaticus]|uniref:Glycosyltransferase RgtA/B/C/D-like domain-containing protein n=1 Tax=Candidatus Raskinella chloraquaticus TaxID=1951219 RepID=A0A1W9HQA0_9HYPH|nr:MAG: hypothetical protein A4S15_01355 [Proteobacteria bacterium SG_bin8]